MTKTILAAGIAAAAIFASASAAPADHWTPADLAKAGDTLKAQAAASGSAGEMLVKYAGHHTMLAFKTKDGPAEIHAQYADIFYVVRGKATLLTEGQLEAPHDDGPGEIKGSKVIGGKTTVLQSGDVVHIPAGTPHQLLVTPGDEFLYFVVKIKEHD